jgi:hypothetical protein
MLNENALKIINPRNTNISYVRVIVIYTYSFFEYSSGGWMILMSMFSIDKNTTKRVSHITFLKKLVDRLNLLILRKLLNKYERTRTSCLEFSSSN